MIWFIAGILCGVASVAVLALVSAEREYQQKPKWYFNANEYSDNYGWNPISKN